MASNIDFLWLSTICFDLVSSFSTIFNHSSNSHSSFLHFSFIPLFSPHSYNNLLFLQFLAPFLLSIPFSFYRLYRFFLFCFITPNYLSHRSDLILHTLYSLILSYLVLNSNSGNSGPLTILATYYLKEIIKSPPQCSEANLRKNFSCWPAQLSSL